MVVYYYSTDTVTTFQGEQGVLALLPITGIPSSIKCRQINQTLNKQHGSPHARLLEHQNKLVVLIKCDN
jgi:hypothetical protein